VIERGFLVSGLKSIHSLAYEVEQLQKRDGSMVLNGLISCMRVREIELMRWAVDEL
jgi:hypothetical protein